MRVFRWGSREVINSPLEVEMQVLAGGRVNALVYIYQAPLESPEAASSPVQAPRSGPFRDTFP